MNPNEPSRFKIVERPPTLPGCCSLTGKSDDEWFFMIEDKDAFHGVFYISKSAFEELASLVNYGPKTSRAQLRETLNGLDPLLGTTLDRLRNFSSDLLPTQELIESVNSLSNEVARLSARVTRSTEEPAKQVTSS